MIVLLCLTPVFKNMPQNAQAAVIIAAVIGLFRYDEFLFLWKVNYVCHIQVKPAQSCFRHANVICGETGADELLQLSAGGIKLTASC